MRQRGEWSAALAALAALAAAALAAPSEARAEADVQTSVAASAGWTDDATISGGGTGAPASVVTNVSPSIIAAWDKGASIWRLGYTFGASVFLQSEGANAYTNSGSAQLALTGSPRTTWLFDVGVAHTQANAQALLAAPSAGAGGLQLGGTGAFVLVTAGEGMAYELGPLWRLVQGLTASANRTLDEAAVGDAEIYTFSLGLERELRFGSFGLQGLASLAHGEIDAGMGAVEVQEVAVGTLLARWRRELSPAWVTELSGGAIVATRLDTGEGALTPLGVWTLDWTGKEGQGGLTVGHTAAFNPQLGTTLITDQFLLRGGLPLSPRLNLAGTLSATRGATTLEGPDSDVVYTFSLDAELGYELTSTSALGLRGQLAYQDADDPRFADVARTSLLVTYTVRWPDELRTMMPVSGTHRMLRAPEIEVPGGRSRR